MVELIHSAGCSRFPLPCRFVQVNELLRVNGNKLSPIGYLSTLNCQILKRQIVYLQPSNNFSSISKLCF